MLGRITKNSVEQLAAGERLWDHGHREVVKGFGVRRQGDAITYYVRFRFQGIQRMCALGSHGHLTPDEARILAKQKLGQVAGGVDPFAEEKKARETARAHGRDAAGTVFPDCLRAVAATGHHRCGAHQPDAGPDRSTAWL